jgi:uncharacterized repeat protein (TIGR02543 family)
VYKTVDVLKGNSVADDDIPKLTKTGYTFLGWGYNDTATPPNVIPVNSGTAITANLILSPQWYTGTPPDVVIGDGTTGNLATTLMTKILGASPGSTVVDNGNGTFTQTDGIWTLRLSEISPIWFAAKTITFTFNYTAGASGAHNWKTGNLWTDNTDAAPTEGGQYPAVPSAGGMKAYTFNISALSKGGLSSQTNGTTNYTFEIVKVELKF